MIISNETFELNRKIKKNMEIYWKLILCRSIIGPFLSKIIMWKWILIRMKLN